MNTQSMRNTRGVGTYVPGAESASAVVEVKAKLSAGRGMRDALVQLVGVLTETPEKRAYLLLVDPRLSVPHLQGEARRFQAALRLDIADRLRVLVFRDGRFEEDTADMPPEDRLLLDQCIDGAVTTASPLPRPNKKSEVFRVMLHQWILCLGPMTSNWLAEIVGCNYRTVASTVERLGRAVKRHSDRRIQLKYFPKNAWSQFLAVAPTARATMNYVDRSDQPRSPESLVRRLHKLGRTDIAVGGVLGAKRYYADLNIVGSPRLDLCVHVDGKHVDLDFVQNLDPALERSRDLDAPARLALHFVRRKDSLFDKGDDGTLWADPVECLLDLHEAHLESQAFAFAEHLAGRGEALSG